MPLTGKATPAPLSKEPDWDEMSILEIHALVGGWFENKYNTVNGTRYGPYRVFRWRDGKGKQRMRYIGKVR